VSGHPQVPQVGLVVAAQWDVFRPSYQNRGIGGLSTVDKKYEFIFVVI
jgi:hypothetical protein